VSFELKTVNRVYFNRSLRVVILSSINGYFKTNNPIYEPVKGY
jgi:hypothetical protein